MKNYEKYIVENDEFVYDEGSSAGKVGNSLSKHDTELFNDDDNKPGKVLRIKRVPVEKGGALEDWNVLDNDNKILLNIKGSRFTSKEKDFMKTSVGMSFLLEGFRVGWRSIAEFKRNIADKITKE
jgi:hypothetical protein